MLLCQWTAGILLFTKGNVVFTVSFKPELLAMDFCSHFIMSERLLSWLVCFYFMRIFRALQHLQFSLHTCSTGTGGSSWMGGAGAGLQIKVKDKIQRLNSADVSAHSDLDPKLAGCFTSASGEGNRTCNPPPWRPRMWWKTRLWICRVKTRWFWDQRVFWILTSWFTTSKRLYSSWLHLSITWQAQGTCALLLMCVA